ncbi:MAG: serine hydroxymethyltransferase [Candidatus Komeilibacteria bacterium CG10_big_fil_rev_8_21_14_0_10_41_13]|uniref:Serine hydroxymethyltransferase n=1 Tax=Candidatus Komeilibacteria bacterium CG10_big_fil_rev_8_21_14_0_10_41_13 TaxID=1974476 RepID=A0A2M6WD15_9BACT|nr:MAG: serine hydroxymethyltransferase [Candidatus Komeilibacteria bacterium CG10_big_fil_rev_8_21_14_0_10_41_13]
MTINQQDPQLAEYLQKELDRQRHGLEMIPSENFVSEEVLEVLGSIGTNKYSEGYPGRRYYGGCEFIDQIELLAIERAKKLFGVDHANVQPYSGSPANLAVYFALLEPGDTVLGASLAFGGHMTHGLKVNFSGTLYNSVNYTADKNGWLDFEEIRRLAQEHKPKMIIAGYTAYPRIIDWQKFRNIADEVGAFLMADISHIAGLVASGQHPSPVGIADVITTTTHKTLRGPRGAMILSNGKVSNPTKKVEKTKENIPTLIDRAIIPGLQGGPHNHTTAAIALALAEALEPEFKNYARQIVLNAKALAQSLMNEGLELVTGGTDNHLMIINLTNLGLGGKEAEKALDEASITCNKNTVPFDTRSPFDPSGIRLGTPALTSRGFKEEEMKTIGQLIAKLLKNLNNSEIKEEIKKSVRELTDNHPLYPNLKYN